MTNPVFLDYSAGYCVEREVLSIRCKAFAWQSAGELNKVIVDADCRIKVWMPTAEEFIQEYDGGFFTDMHTLRSDIQRKIQKRIGYLKPVFRSR